MKLAIDYGKNKIGLAITDELEITAIEFGVLENNNEIFLKLGEIIEKNKIDTIIIGLPSSGSLEIEKFTLGISTRFSIPVININEDFTTNEANVILFNKTRSKSRINKQKKMNKDDAKVAQILLQTYLNSPL